MRTIASEVADPVKVVVRQPSAIRNAPSPTSEIVRAVHRRRKSELRNAWSACAPAKSPRSSDMRQRYPRAVAGAVRGVLLDVDFTLARPGPELGAAGYEQLGRDHGLALDITRYPDARAAAVADLRAHPELDHDEEVWVRFTEDVVRGMGGAGAEVELVARAIVGRWEHAHHFELYDDALPTLAALRDAGLRLGLISNTSRDLDAFIRHHAIDVDAWLTSGAHGKVKPSPAIFAAALDLIGIAAAEAVMVGDSPEDDIRGARAIGMRAILLDRANEHADEMERIQSLSELPALIS